MTIEWRRLRHGETDHELVWGLVGLAGAAMAGIVLATGTLPHVVCPFREITGWPCPTCGATRAWLSLASGDVLGAFRLNPAAAAALVAAVPYLLYALVVALVDLPRLRVKLAGADGTVIRAVAVAVTLATWVFLIRDGR